MHHNDSFHCPRCKSDKLHKFGRDWCSYKLNLNLDCTPQFKMVTEPDKIELVAGRIDSVFRWNRMRFDKATVALVLYYTICEAMPAPQVARTMRNIHHIVVSHDTITRWHHKAAFLFSAKTLEVVKIPAKKGRKPRLYADETERKVHGEKRWFWLSYCRKYDLMLGRNLTKRRSTKSAETYWQ